MRPLLAIAVSTVILAGLALYTMLVVQTRPEVTQFAEPAAAGQFTIEVTTSFSAQPDPFALNLDDQTKAAGLLLRLSGRGVEYRRLTLAAGSPLTFGPVEQGGIVVGDNELYLEAYPPLDDAGRLHAVRVRILRDGRLIDGAEKTFWSQPGTPLKETFRIHVTGEEKETGNHNHDPS